jgi:MFS family permease
LGLCLGALSFGVLLGSVFGSHLLVNRFGRYRVRIGLGFLEGIALASVGLAFDPYLMLLALTLAGICNAAMSLVGATHRALAMPKEYRVRMLAAGSMTTQTAGAIGPALVGAALTSFSVTWVYTACGLLMATCVLGFLAVPRFREFLSLRHDEIADWYRLQYPEIFK